jgi:prepilin-type N-terminal cleavage/methylation domain-containing protein
MLKNNKGFTLIELIMVTIILGILAAVAIPRYASTLAMATERTEKAFVDQLWLGCEIVASERLIEFGIEEWPFNPLTTIKRNRGIVLNLTLGVPDEDNEWQFSLDAADDPAVFHQRANDDIYYYTYDSTNFELSEVPALYTPTQ